MYREIKGYSGGEVYEYTSSMQHDKEILREAVSVVAAHTIHLHEQGIINQEAYCRVATHILGLLENPWVIYEQEGEYEDVWEAIEAWLTKKAGSYAGEIWIGRSRNDHVSTALRLRAIRGAVSVMKLLNKYRNTIIDKALASRGKWILLHTHSQPAQLAPAPCLLLAWEETLASIYSQLEHAVGALNRSPLGSSAGAGSIAPLDPSRLASLLGLAETIPIPLYATGSRLDLSLYASTIAMLLVELSRMAEDLMLLSSPYVGVIVLPDSHVATSSIMPHKRNPATLEVLRARAKLAVSMLSGLLGVQTGLPSGYSLDLQEVNPIIYWLESEASHALEVMDSIVEGFTWDDEALERMQKNFIGYGAELAEYIALTKKIPFREAYKLVVEALRDGDPGELLEEYGFKSPVELASLRRTGCKAELDIETVLERLQRDNSILERLDTGLSGIQLGLKEALAKSLRGCEGGN